MKNGGYYWNIETRYYFESLKILKIPKSNHLWSHKCTSTLSDKGIDLYNHVKLYKNINLCFGTMDTTAKPDWFWISDVLKPEKYNFVYKGDLLTVLRKNKIKKIENEQIRLKKRK